MSSVARDGVLHAEGHHPRRKFQERSVTCAAVRLTAYRACGTLKTRVYTIRLLVSDRVAGPSISTVTARYATIEVQLSGVLMLY